MLPGLVSRGRVVARRRVECTGVTAFTVAADCFFQLSCFYVAVPQNFGRLFCIFLVAWTVAAPLA